MAVILHPSNLLFLKPKDTIIHLPHKIPYSKTIKSQDSKSQGQGFSPKQKPSKKKERATVIRRAPVQNPQFVASKKGKALADEQLKNESSFLLTWSGLGGLILLQGIALSASGFLPEDWDKFLVKYLYPTFTPTVFLFVAGSVAYGGLKYLQNEKLKNEK